MNQSTNGPLSRFGAGAAELHREFKLVDRDRDGRVDFNEFKELMLDWKPACRRRRCAAASTK